MTEQWWQNVEDDPVHAQAVRWFTRLREPHVSVDVMLEWQRWMGADTRHTLAYNRMEEVWCALSEVSPDTYALSAPRNRTRYRWAIAAAVAATAMLIGWLAVSRDRLSWTGVRTIVITTAIGENRVVALADGSQVTLGGNTSLEIAFGSDARRIELGNGEAIFKVAKDSRRPFRVRAGKAAVTAVGTEFNVRRGVDRVTVAVVEGRVVVAPTAYLIPASVLKDLRPKMQPVKVDAGQQATVGNVGMEGPPVLADWQTATAWQTGRLAFQGEPLRYVLADVNRYSAKPIVLADDSIGSLSITGTVAGDKTSEWIASLEKAFGLVAKREPDRIVLSRRSD